MGFVIKIMIAVFCVNMTCSATTLEQRVDRLYNRMSMAERVAQLRSIYMSELFTPDGKIDEAKCKKSRWHRAYIPICYGFRKIAQ